MSSQKLRRFCASQNLTLTKCNKPGYWMVSFSDRPKSEQFFKFKKNVNAIGYDYVSDGQDNAGYYMVIGKKK